MLSGQISHFVGFVGERILPEVCAVDPAAEPAEHLPPDPALPGRAAGDKGVLRVHRQRGVGHLQQAGPLCLASHGRRPGGDPALHQVWRWNVSRALAPAGAVGLGM